MTTLPIHPKAAVADGPLSQERTANIATWTEHTAQPLPSEPVLPIPIRGTNVTLSIPLDESQKRSTAIDDDEEVAAAPPRRPKTPPSRRDSLKRREALLKGKEGSRQRRRWENDRLLNNPHAVPPLPSDWEVHPTYPRHAVPYYLAPLWDEAAYHRNLERKREATKHAKLHRAANGGDTAAAVPHEVREKLKRARAAKGLLQGLEEEVRTFLKQWEEREQERRNVGLEDVDSEGSDEDEVVFVGRNGLMRDEWRERWKNEGKGEVGKERMVFEGMEGDRGAAFGRWLVHNIATYYGLRTWSVTVGDPARREAYVGIQERKAGTMVDTTGSMGLPRPLWCMV